MIPARPPVQGSHGPPNADAPLQPSKHKRGVWEEPSVFTCYILADAFIPKWLTNDDNRSNQNQQKSNDLQVLWQSQLA